MDMSEDTQKNIKIAIQGNPASFHDIAAQQFFGSNAKRVFCDTFSSTFQALADGKSNYALCAIENSLFGSINEVYDLLLRHRFHIIGELYLRIEQCLIGLPGATISGAKKVYSHPVALAQCEQYLDEKLNHAEREEYHDTAAAVGLVKDLASPEILAIASRQAAQLHGLEVLASSIETHKENYTRFVALSKSPTTAMNQDKSSLILEVSHKPGALYEVLGVFAKYNVNLTKLQSRPIPGKAWHYIFYTDIELGATNPVFQKVLNDLHALDCNATLLGSYKAADNLT